MASEKIALYPGTFDPLTSGHLSLIRRGCEIFDKIIVAVAIDSAKSPLFTIEERTEMIKEAVGVNPQVEVEPFSGLLVEYADLKGVHVILRGMRAVSDFEYEFQLALMNRKLKRHIQTVFLMTDYQWLYISSTIVKAAAKLGGDIRGMVPDNVYIRMRERYGYPYPLASPVPRSPEPPEEL
jgi:pantetheine-phosphate adenylyltransferase, bacterial